MRLGALAAVAALALAACGGDDDAPAQADPALARNAVNAVAVLLGDAGAGGPIGESYDCSIQGPAGSTPVPARCLWTAEPEGDQWLVAFRETWPCVEFSRDEPGYPPCAEVLGFHEWEYLVDLRTGQVDQTDETGQFPPDYAP